MPVVLKGDQKKIHAVVSDIEPLGVDPRDQLNLRVQHTQLECVPIGDLKPNRRNAKKHPDRQITLLAENYKAFGFTQPIIIDEDGMILCGHARYFAALKLGLTDLPSIRLSHLSPAEKRGLAIADNKLAELGEWDLDRLPEELGFLFDPKNELTFDPYILGFETPEFDQILQDDPDPGRADPADQTEKPDPTALPTTAAGDLWECGPHKLLCAPALAPADYQALMGHERAELVFADRSQSLPHQGHVTGRSNLREPGAGEITPEAFSAFNRAFCENVLSNLIAGAVVYLCTDWRQLRELQATADAVFGDLKNLIVWVKTDAGKGRLYRPQHEMILVYTAPGGRPTNNVGKGRYRTDVWKYPGFNAFGRDRDQSLHPGLKPVALVADALLDCSKRGAIVLAPFGGSGTTMIAAERTGRRARLLEIDPLCCDFIVQRWQKFSEKIARLAETNESFDEVRARRATTTRGI